MVGENEPQRATIIRPVDKGGYGFDALWNDDFHHSAMVRLVGHSEAYYSDYSGHANEFLSCVKHGFLFQGQYYKWQKKPRGTPCLDIKHSSFILFIQNHDQIANSARGLRIQYLTDAGNYRTMTALTLLAPGTPMLFQGQEFASSSPFYYFADHNDQLSAKINKGREVFLSQFPTPFPSHLTTFMKSKLDFNERKKNQEIYTFHKDLIQLRKTDPCFDNRYSRIDGSTLSEDAFFIRYFGENGDDRLFLINFGIDLTLEKNSDPLLAPSEGNKWVIAWSSDAPKYGGNGVPTIDFKKNWLITGHSAILLKVKKKDG